MFKMLIIVLQYARETWKKLKQQSCVTDKNLGHYWDAIQYYNPATK